MKWGLGSICEFTGRLHGPGRKVRIQSHRTVIGVASLLYISFFHRDADIKVPPSSNIPNSSLSYALSTMTSIIPIIAWVCAYINVDIRKIF
jgi:predicted ATP-binding protein involved in virulence